MFLGMVHMIKEMEMYVNEINRNAIMKNIETKKT